MEQKIKKYFKEHKLPKPVTINLIGNWAHGVCYAVTTGIVRLRRFCVYFTNDEIVSVRERIYK